MNKRLMQLLSTRGALKDGCMIDTYNQQIQYDVSCTIRTNINTANLHFIAIMEEVKIAAMRGRNPDNPSERGKSNGNYQQRLEINENGTSNTITSVQKDNLVVEPKVMQVGNIIDDSDRKFTNPQTGRVYSAQVLAPTINTCQGGGREPKLIIPEATAKGYAEAYEGDSVNLEQPNSKTRRGRVGKQMANTLTTSNAQGGGQLHCCGLPVWNIRADVLSQVY